METFRRSFAREQAHSLEEATTYEKPAKTCGCYRFFSCPLSRARFENQPKIDPKTLRKRVARHMFCETRFFSCWRPQDDSQKFSRLPWGGPCGLLWLSWGTLAALRGTLGELLERSGALWDRSWAGLGALMGRSWTLLSAPRRSLGDFGWMLALPRSILELDSGSETLKLRTI